MRIVCKCYTSDPLVSVLFAERRKAVDLMNLYLNYEIAEADKSCQVLKA